MEGWLYGLFTLLGVLVGGFFTYLGLRRQLAQQKEINEIEWRRKVRSEPLLKLRSELAVITTKFDRLATTAHQLHTRSGFTDEEVNKQLERNIEDINTYLASGNFAQIIFIQYDKRIREAIKNVIQKYRSSYFDAINYKDLKAKELGEAMDVLKDNEDRIIEIQELINKKLEEL